MVLRRKREFFNTVSDKISCWTEKTQQCFFTDASLAMIPQNTFFSCYISSFRSLLSWIDTGWKHFARRLCTVCVCWLAYVLKKCNLSGCGTSVSSRSLFTVASLKTEKDRGNEISATCFFLSTTPYHWCCNEIHQVCSQEKADRQDCAYGGDLAIPQFYPPPSLVTIRRLYRV